MSRNYFSFAFGRCPAALGFVFLIAGFFLTGCEKETQHSPLVKETVKKFEVATALEGSVADDQGPVKTGTVRVLDGQGRMIAGTQLQNGDRYRIEIPAGTVLPVVLSYLPSGKETDAGELITAVVHPNLTVYSINPLSTAIAKKARELGGYTHANLVLAAESMGTVPDANKTTAGFRGDPTKQYGGWH
ncbi:hypothetical protein [Methylosarcina fibrata]|uniref:hypothetical protein n=1 Tax=Methylosarcina fibrata TaxID=105972 RepID=UPI000369FC09|nr:hypothetical protein [Methylosarcina fibrata]